MLGRHSGWEPPESIPNSEVKLTSADDSVVFCHVKVGHCQAFILVILFILLELKLITNVIVMANRQDKGQLSIDDKKIIALVLLNYIFLTNLVKQTGIK